MILKKQLINMSKHNKIQRQNNHNLYHHQAMVFSGPLPHPDVLKKFNEASPGAAEIIIKMAKDQAEHRQELEKRVISSDVKNSKLGLMFGFVISITGICAGVFIINVGQVVAGSVISGMTIVSLVGTFVYGSQGRRREREEKNKNNL